MAAKTKKLQLDHVGSLICLKGTHDLLGYMMEFEGKVFEPTYGAVPVSPDDAKTHNECMTKALIAGLDKCEIGRGGSFYHSVENGLDCVRTFTGELVAGGRDADTYASSAGGTITFTRNGLTFEGDLDHGGSLFYFERIG